METKNKIAAIVTGMLIGAMALMSCKTNFSPEVYQKSDCYDIEAGASFVTFNEEGMFFMMAPGYTFKLPDRMIKYTYITPGTDVIILEKNQYIVIIYDSDYHNFGNKNYSDYDRLIGKIDILLYDPGNTLMLKLYRQFEKAMSNKSSNRIDYIFRKDGFVIGLINFMPQNKDSITELIEETFTIKKYEGQLPVIGFIKDYREK